MTLNADIPPFECLVRAEYLYNQRKGHGQFVRGLAHAITSIQGRALGFHVLLENGAHISRLPISALAHRTDAPVWMLDVLQLWDCFSYDAAVIEHAHLSQMRVVCFLKGHKPQPGTYLFTVDWCGNNYSENPGDTGFKTAHVIEPDNGLYAAQPNNRVQFYPSPRF